MNRGYKLSKRSGDFVKTLTPPLQKVIMSGLHIANTRKLFCPDFSITQGIRSAETQFELYKKGRNFKSGEWVKTGKTVTNCDGYDKISDHQKVDENGLALAFDFCAYVNGANYSNGNMALIVTAFFEAASNEGVSIDWGGSYRSISDSCHVSYCPVGRWY